jgi:hypothetical protein
MGQGSPSKDAAPSSSSSVPVPVKAASVALPVQSEIQPASPLKRGPGRPRKDATVPSNLQPASQPKQELQPASPLKRGPGRPRKEVTPNPALAVSTPPEEAVQVAPVSQVPLQPKAVSQDPVSRPEAHLKSVLQATVHVEPASSSRVPPRATFDGPVPTFHLPEEVGARVRSHRLDADNVVTEAEVAGLSYRMSSRLEGYQTGGEMARFARALRTVRNSFPGAVVTQTEAPTGELDSGWRIHFDFSRSPEQAAWDARLAECSINLFRCTRHEGRLAEARQSGFLDHKLLSCSKTLAECRDATADPLFAVALKMLSGFWSDTPQARIKPEMFAPQEMDDDQVDDLVTYGQAMLQDMLDCGTGRDGPKPPPPMDEEDAEDLAKLTWARVSCRTTLFLLERDRFLHAGRSLFDDLVGASALLKSMDEDYGEPVLRKAADLMMWASGRILAEHGRATASTPPAMTMDEVDGVLREATRILHEEAMIVAPADDHEAGQVREDEEEEEEDSLAIPMDGRAIPGFSR